MTSESIAHSVSWAIDSELIRARGIIVNKPGGVLLEILGGVFRPFRQILTTFHINFQTWPLRNYVSIN